MAPRPSSAAVRQRGIFSEVLLIETKPGTEKLAGPTTSRQIRSTREPRPLSANGFTQRTRHVPALQTAEKVLRTVIEPKVLEGHRAIAGRCPRRLRIERLKRKYESQDICKLLAERGVDVTLPWYEDSSPLPLEAFDNKDYDLRTPHEWIALAKQDGVFKPLPALALWREPDGKGHWRRALVMQYDEASEKFEVQYEETEPTEIGGRRGAMEFLPRLRVMFRGEDPEAFANRVEEAYKSRRQADSMLRYNFYIDNMPTEDVQQLSSGQIEWLENAVKSGRKSEDVSELEFILQEVQLDFARAMNKVTFDTNILQGEDPLNQRLLPFAEKGPVGEVLLGKPPAPLKGRKPVPKHRFAETFARLCFATLRVRPEVVLALQGIKAESEERLHENLFSLDTSRPLRLDEFQQNLRSSCAEAALSLKEDWPTCLQTIVLREFGSVQKGWFTVREHNVDLYRHGKLRRFVLLARLIMQDTLRNIARKSVDDIVTTIETLAPRQVTVESVSYSSATFRTAAQAASLAVEVRPVEVEGTWHFDFIVAPSRFLPTALSAYDAGLQVLNEVHPLERLMIPPRLQSEGSALIEAFHQDEVWVQEGRVRIAQCLETAAQAPVEFLKLLQVWEPLMRRDVARSVDAMFEDAEPSDAEVQEAVSEAIRQQKELILTLPEMVDVGMYQVTTKEVRRALVAKHKVRQSLLMDRLVKRLRGHMDATVSDTRSLIAMITKAPKNVEELVQMRASIVTLPQEISDMRARIARHIKLYEEIEGFCHQLSPEDFRLRWELVAAPSQATAALGQKRTALSEYEAEFVRELLKQQDDLQELIEEIESTVKLFRSQPQYWDIGSLSTAREAAESLQERVDKATQDANSINQKEVMLDRKVTDYSCIMNSAYNFEPFCKVWQVVYAFHEDQTKWRLGLVTEPDALRRKLLQGCQVVEKACKRLQTGNWPAKMVEFGKSQLLQMEEFQILLLSVDHPHHEPLE